MTRTRQLCRRLRAVAAAAALCFSPWAAGSAPPLGVVLQLDEAARPLNIDPQQISVSGISSGGFMAHQFHIAHSANIMGVGIVAGGPYGCSVASAESAGEKGINAAISQCSKFMALTCKDFLNGPLMHLAGLCDQPYSGPATDGQARELAGRSFALAQATAAAGQIDTPANIARARVFLFTGTNDEIVPYDVMNAVFHLYADPDKANVAAGNIDLNRMFRAHHTMVTDNFYKATPYYVGICNVTHVTFGDPYIGDCRLPAQSMVNDTCGCSAGMGQACSSSEAQQLCAADSRYRQVWPDPATCMQNVSRETCVDARQVDLAGAILQTIYEPDFNGPRQALLTPSELRNLRTAVELSRLRASRMTPFSQAKLVEHSFGEKDAGTWASLADTGYLYIPDTCAKGATCRLHIALHGCKQGGANDPASPQHGNIFARYAGYNEWAKNNSTVVLYPQVQAQQWGPLNPQGCWDWWGEYYTGDAYFTQAGRQIKAVALMVNTLLKKDLLRVPGSNQQIGNLSQPTVR